MNKRFSLMLHPPPEVTRLDTSLRYTDILFGFVIREMFLRLQYWQNLPSYVFMHLAVCTTLVLGSWIGYRRSLNRSAFEVKFFNLPFFRFLLDQAMLILYFQIVGSTPVDPGKPVTDSSTLSVLPDPSALAIGTVKLLFFIFLLYWLWDALGIWMAISTVSQNPRYPDARGNVDDQNQIKVVTKRQKPDWSAFTITGVGVGILAVLYFPCHNSITPTATFILLILLLLVYRLAKEIRTSWR